MTPACRFCGAGLSNVFVDLGMSPLANSFPRAEDSSAMEPTYPLTVYLCDACLLVQLPAVQTPEQIFSDYAYFSSYSETWLKHAQEYAHEMTSRFDLGHKSQVVEVASNDGYLLRYFKERGIPVLGVEPAANVAAVAQSAGIPTTVRFFGVATARDLAEQGNAADLLVGNNVLAHVPDINDFVSGLKIALKPCGAITMEFPYLARLIEGNQFDTIYHEHFSYFTLGTVERIFAAHDLAITDAEELTTHGGSLRIYARHADSARGDRSEEMVRLLERERACGYHLPDAFRAFAPRVAETKWRLLELLIETKRAGKTVVGYGAAAKGATLINYCGLRTDFLDYVVDRSPHKQGLLMPGSRIPIAAPEQVSVTRPDYLLILAWNLKGEIMRQMDSIRAWGGRFIVPIPSAEIAA